MTSPVVSRIEVEPGVFLSVATRGDPAGPALVFSNSLAADRRMWDGVVAALGERGRLVTYDTRGHGNSDVPAGPYSLSRLGEDVVAILDALGIARACFCGLSLGGLTGMWLAAHRPDRVSGLILANTAPAFPPASMWRERAQVARSEGVGPLAAGTLERWLTAGFRAENPDQVETVRDMIAATPPEGYAACCAVLGEADMTVALASIRCPVLVVTGRHDASTPPATGRSVLDGIGHGDLIELATAHLSAIEQPPEFAEAAGRFLDRLGC